MTSLQLMAVKDATRKQGYELGALKTQKPFATNIENRARMGK
jgi:hypothetical protein